QTHPCTTMLTYAKLPREKYLINWPIHGNDFYANMVEMNSTDRAEVYQQAKNRTLAFIYFIQHELGFKNLGLADDEYDTRDLLPFIPYHREGRRIHGISRFTCDHILDPYATTLYRTGIAVGDYPIDHHHGKNPNAPAIIFPSIPAFSIPLGALIPKSVEDLLIADKAISVSNIANGSTRLQPVMLQVGQAAGTTAALAVKENKRPREVSLRAVQRKVLNQGGYIVPSYDVLPDDPHFRSMQMAGATGLIRGLGEPHAWANRTWYYPDSTMSRMELSMNLSQYVQLVWQNGDQEPLTTLDFLHSAFTGLAARFTFAVRTCSESEWSDLGLKNYNVHRPLTRREISVAVEHMIPLFDLEVNHEGKLVSTVF
ncbi:MAG: FAD-dependent oxidoreductase, partial [Saprospiraceae bacterium]|nr:FAD-dependent oxidoreductase [Saprospiraceae bacterium]